MTTRVLTFVKPAVPHTREFAIIGAAYAVYMLIRALLIIDAPIVPFENAKTVVALEQSLGVFWEPAAQAWALDNLHSAVVIANWVYIFAFYPIIITSSVFLYVRYRSQYDYYRPVVLISFAIALISFSIFPLAPPRMLTGQFIDTISEFGPAFYSSTQVGAAYNAFAAMPSLHFGWSIAFGVIFYRSGNKTLRILGVAYPIIMLFAIVITGAHFMLDAVGGALVMVAAFVLVSMWRRFRVAHGSTPLRDFLRLPSVR
ncbi:MAG: phosphatase PAP2 family protein [Chloroflexi bacterium]|nr:phosphatase PAP2 family protein [Chloroflexota bacterium]